MSSRSSANTLEEREPSATPIAPRSRSTSASNIETARQLFVEQLDFLDKEKEKLIQELPPLAPVASSEDLSSSEAEHSPSPKGAQKESKRNSPSSRRFTDMDENGEYAIDINSPPVLCKLPNSFHRSRIVGDYRRRLPSWSQRQHFAEDQIIFKLTFEECEDV
uniref:Uncharacterized protein n=1 Tax=Panagrolaimus superbus TaxID=310955 RepID=A0A914Y550_9BILA